jgi:ABC-2 type transport system permease protein
MGDLSAGNQKGTSDREAWPLSAAGARSVAAGPRHPLGLRAATAGIGNEVYKGLLAGWSERVQILIELPLFISFFLLFGVLVGRGPEVAATGEIPWSFETERMSWLFVGFMAFTFFYLQSVKLFWRLIGEIQTGTLEQVYLSPLPTWLVAAAGRVVAAVVETLFVVSMMFAATSLFVDLELPLRAQAVVPLAFLLIGSVGYSLLIGGITLILKRVEMLADLMLLPVFVAGGLFVPLSDMPGWLAAVGGALPITHSLELLRSVLLEGGSVGNLWGNGGLIPASISSIAWLGLGVASFKLGERFAKRRGTLSHV